MYEMAELIWILIITIVVIIIILEIELKIGIICSILVVQIFPLTSMVIKILVSKILII
jgi:hypothetical protein